uniref:C1q domain-containing protein n=1 Tax=Seriola dumerili TaxID=41447 RepID=A0A3B4T704_SERDU
MKFVLYVSMKSLCLCVCRCLSLCAGNYSHLGTGTSLAVCQPDTCALLSEVAAMREKLAALIQAEELWKVNQAQDKQLNALTDVSSTSVSKMAFTAALGSSVGPFEQDTPLKYQRILSNIGSGYNPATGIFTAMTRGLYYFSYTMYNNNSGQPNSVASLMMNSQKVVSTWDTVGDDSQDSATNAAVVQLEAGDSVFVKLYANRVLYDDGYYYNTFSGFLLFTL